jgi:hypothetical protein
MALPKLQTSEYTLTLPSTQEEIKYRPFLVKEQKILMIAQESGNEQEITDAMANLIHNCTFGALDVNNVPMFDVEYVFLQIRSKSSGSVVTLSVICPDDEETAVEVKINLDEIEVQRNVEHSQEIEITKDIKLNLRYPRLKDLKGLNDNFGEFEKTLVLVVECVDTITSGEEVINRIDMTQDGVLKFFETMPKVRHIIDVVNPKTKKKGEVLLEGLESFLE